MVARRMIKKNPIIVMTIDAWLCTYKYEYREADFVCHLLGEALEGPER
jgi:hypothetical protein